MKTGALWPDLLTAEELASLDPGLPADMEQRPDVLVIGGGVIGVATAFACTKAGVSSVVLMERHRLGAGASGGAGGLLVAEAQRGIDPTPLVQFGRSSLAMWRDLEATEPGGVGLVDLNWLALESDRPDLADDLPAGAERLDADDVGQLIPGLAQPVAAALIRHQGRVNPLSAIVRLARGIPAVWTGVTALGVSVRGGRVASVATSVGEVSPGAVIFATGSPPKLDGLDLEVPFGEVKGHIITTGPGSVLLPGTVSSVGTQLEDGRLLAGGTLDVGDPSPAVRPSVISAIRSTLAAALPATRGRPLSHGWCCFRPTHPDGMPIIDRVPGLANAWLTSGHFRGGILMAPATGRALAEWIASGRQPPEVAGLEIGRFAAA